MLVKDLIEQLQKMPPDANVYHVWDGEPRTGINFVWVDRTGDVLTADYDEVCYSEESWPVGATATRFGHWYTPSKGKNYAK
jgi:hypothetical protein